MPSSTGVLAFCIISLQPSIAVFPVVIYRLMGLISPLQDSIRAINVFLLCGLVSLLPGCTSPQRNAYTTTSQAQFGLGKNNQVTININIASQDELEKLPGIGPGLARRILEHRNRFGKFRRPEHLIMVRGLSDRRFREMRAFVRVE